MLSKANLRAEMKTRLRALKEQPEDLRERTLSLNRHVQNFLRQKQGVWAGYMPLPSEPDILPAIEQSPHIRWVYPRVVGADLQFHSSVRRDTFVAGAFGVQEPNADDPAVELGSIDGFLVPGLAFGREGARLGRGKGFYDRTLSQTRAERVGVCYSLQLLNAGEIPLESGDVPVHLTITENGREDARSVEEN